MTKINASTAVPAGKMHKQRVLFVGSAPRLTSYMQYAAQISAMGFEPQFCHFQTPGSDYSVDGVPIALTTRDPQEVMHYVAVTEPKIDMVVVCDQERGTKYGVDVVKALRDSPSTRKRPVAVAYANPPTVAENAAAKAAGAVGAYDGSGATIVNGNGPLVALQKAQDASQKK